MDITIKTFQPTVMMQSEPYQKIAKGCNFGRNVTLRPT